MTLPKTLETHENGRLVWDIAAAADDRKAEDIAILKVDQISYLADFFVVATGFSRTQVRAIADAIEERLETKIWQSAPTDGGQKRRDVDSPRLWRSDCTHLSAAGTGIL